MCGRSRRTKIAQRGALPTATSTTTGPGTVIFYRCMTLSSRTSLMNGGDYSRTPFAGSNLATKPEINRRTNDMEKYDWPKVMEALQFLLEKTQEEEPHATGFIASLEDVLASMPDEAFQ